MTATSTDMSSTDTSLPESLLVLVRDSGETTGLHILKAANPEGEVVAFAFTREVAMKEFARKAGFALDKADIRGVRVPTASLLEELAGADETKLHIDPMQEDERVLYYEGNGVLKREHADLKRDIRKARAPLPDRFVASLRLVATGLPTVESIWLLESAPEGEHLAADVRMLLVVKQSIGADVEGFDLAFMELGDRWCETLPAGIAVDMAPWEVEGMREHLDDTCRVYSREGAAPNTGTHPHGRGDEHECCGGGSCGR